MNGFMNCLGAVLIGLGTACAVVFVAGVYVWVKNFMKLYRR